MDPYGIVMTVIAGVEFIGLISFCIYAKRLLKRKPILSTELMGTSLTV